MGKLIPTTEARNYGATGADLYALVGTIAQLPEAEQAAWKSVTDITTVKVGDIAYVQSHGDLRRGVITKIGRTRIAVAYTTAGAITESARYNPKHVMVTNITVAMNFVCVKTAAAPAPAAAQDEAAPAPVAPAQDQAAPVAIIWDDPRHYNPPVGAPHTLHTATCGDVKRAHHRNPRDVAQFTDAAEARAFVERQTLGDVDDAPCLRRDRKATPAGQDTPTGTGDPTTAPTDQPAAGDVDQGDAPESIRIEVNLAGLNDKLARTGKGPVTVDDLARAGMVPKQTGQAAAEWPVDPVERALAGEVYPGDAVTTARAEVAYPALPTDDMPAMRAYLGREIGNTAVVAEMDDAEVCKVVNKHNAGYHRDIIRVAERVGGRLGQDTSRDRERYSAGAVYLEVTWADTGRHVLAPAGNFTLVEWFPVPGSWGWRRAVCVDCGSTAVCLSSAGDTRTQQTRPRCARHALADHVGLYEQAHRLSWNGRPPALDRWPAMIPDPHPLANCGPLNLALQAGSRCPTCGAVIPTPDTAGDVGRETARQAAWNEMGMGHAMPTAVELQAQPEQQHAAQDDTTRPALTFAEQRAAYRAAHGDAGKSAAKCLDQRETRPCTGPVRLREALTITGIRYERCDGHWTAAQSRARDVARRYPEHQPADFDPAYAGERWNEDD